MMPAIAMIALGCAQLEGKWSLAKVDPTAARRDFEFESLTIQKDGTFYGESRGAADTRSISGDWTVKGGVLSLKDHDGNVYTYDSELSPDGGELTLSRHWERTRMQAVMEKRK